MFQLNDVERGSYEETFSPKTLSAAKMNLFFISVVLAVEHAFSLPHWLFYMNKVINVITIGVRVGNGKLRYCRLNRFLTLHFVMALML